MRLLVSHSAVNRDLFIKHAQERLNLWRPPPLELYYEPHMLSDTGYEYVRYFRCVYITARQNPVDALAPYVSMFLPFIENRDFANALKFLVKALPFLRVYTRD